MLDLEDERGEAQIYFCSYCQTEYGPFPETTEAYAATRTSQLAEGIDLLATTPLRHVLVGGKPAVQSTAKFWRRDESRSFEWSCTYVDAGDRRDEVVGSDRHFERVRPALNTFLRELVYR